MCLISTIAITCDILQRFITFCITCCLGIALCVGCSVGILTGIAYGHNYFLAQVHLKKNPEPPLLRKMFAFPSLQSSPHTRTATEMNLLLSKIVSTATNANDRHHVTTEPYQQSSPEFFKEATRIKPPTSIQDVSVSTSPKPIKVNFPWLSSTMVWANGTTMVFRDFVPFAAITRDSTSVKGTDFQWMRRVFPIVPTTSAPNDDEDTLLKLRPTEHD